MWESVKYSLLTKSSIGITKNLRCSDYLTVRYYYSGNNPCYYFLHLWLNAIDVLTCLVQPLICIHQMGGSEDGQTPGAPLLGNGGQAISDEGRFFN